MTNAPRWNLPLPTLGGVQLWTDYRWWFGWRVQYLSSFNSWRLIDPNNIRRAWGGRSEVFEAYENAVASAKIAEDVDSTNHVVILIHGLLRTSQSMRSMAREIEKSKVGTPVSFSYASSRESISSHAEALRQFIHHLPWFYHRHPDQLPQLSFVGHSLGNIVVRHLFADCMRDDPKDSILTQSHRFVMLGPPNQGSAFARRLSKLGLFDIITGESGRHLGPTWETLRENLAIPSCEFAIIAGDMSRSRWKLHNPWIEGPSDLVVTLEEARLERATEVATVPILHSFLMTHPRTIKATVGYLQGRTLSEALADKP